MANVTKMSQGFQGFCFLLLLVLCLRMKIPKVFVSILCFAACITTVPILCPARLCVPPSVATKCLIPFGWFFCRNLSQVVICATNRRCTMSDCLCSYDIVVYFNGCRVAQLLHIQSPTALTHERQLGLVGADDYHCLNLLQVPHDKYFTPVY